MPHRNLDFEAGNYYHVYNKSISGVDLFKDDLDRLVFLFFLAKSAEKFNITLIAWCLLGNHFHLLLRQDGTETVSQFMQWACNRYAVLSNHFHGRKGHLFYRVFGAKHVNTDSYMRRLCCYIHANPVKAGLVKKAEDWLYCNYMDFLDPEFWKKLNDPILSELFGNGEGYAEALQEHMANSSNYPVDWKFKTLKMSQSKKASHWDTDLSKQSKHLRELLNKNRSALKKYCFNNDEELEAGPTKSNPKSSAKKSTGSSRSPRRKKSR